MVKNRVFFDFFELDFVDFTLPDQCKLDPKTNPF